MTFLLMLLFTLLALPAAVAIIALRQTRRLERRVAMLEAALAGAASGPPAEPRPATASVAETPAPPPERAQPGRGWREAVTPRLPSWSRGAAGSLGRGLARLDGSARRWLTEGNLPVKVGILVLFAGVAALIRHASEQGWLTLPVELRLAGIAALAVIGLAFGWQQRLARRVFALSLQGGAIGVLLMVIFAAAQRFELLPLPLAFATSVGLVAGLCVLGVAQNALSLAVLGSLAGFLAPLWLARGPGEPVVLFGYYALLNLGIAAIAWYRPWRILNLLGFVATFGIATAWGVVAYRPADFAVAQPFLALYFVIYLLLPVLYARRRREQDSPGRSVGRIDGSLVFGAPLIAFGLEAGLLEGERLPLAFCALGLAALYMLLAAGLTRRDEMRGLGEAHAILAVGFATLAIPLAFSAQVSASLFAMEGAALVWLGLRQQRLLPRLSGLALQGVAGLVLFGELVFAAPGSVPLANAGFLAGAMISAAGLICAELLWRGRRPRWALAAYAWGLAGWLAIAAREIDLFAGVPLADDWRLALLALTGLALAERYRRRPAAALAWCIAGGLLVAAGLLAGALNDALTMAPASAGLAPWGWGLVVLLGYRQLQALAFPHLADATPPSCAAWAQGAWLWCWPLFLCTLLLQPVPLDLAPSWQLAAAVLPWLAVTALLVLRPGLVLRPLMDAAMAWRPALTSGFLLALTLAWVLLLARPGDPSPLPWLPLLNPLALVQWASLLLAWRLWRGGLWPAQSARRAPALFGAAAFVLLSLEVVRGAHLLAGVPWAPRLLESGLVQTGLTLLWSVLGVAGWVFGSRHRHRLAWQVSAALMAVVLIKLVVVDRQHLGNLLGIASFIGYGLLCIGVGFIAPAPPRQQEDAG